MSGSALEGRLGYRFREPALLRDALTHRSAGSNHNERLEFLGDGALNFIIAHELYRRVPDADEGDLSRLRASLVRRETLSGVARELDLGNVLVMGPGEARSGGHQRQSTLGDALEAVLGAVYLDGGFSACREVVLSLFAKRLDHLPPLESLKDPKTRLQEYLQARRLPLPDYTLAARRGAEHARTFEVACSVAGLSDPVRGTGGSRRAAEQDAARRALQALDVAEPAASADGRGA